MASSSVVPRALDQMEGLLAAVTSDDLGRPTPCRDWTVADLVDHVVFSVTGLGAMARGEDVDWAAEVPRQADPAPAFRVAADGLAAAIDTSGGQFPEGLAAGELAVHAWDLSTALGRGSAELDPEIAETGHAFMSGALTDEQRVGAFDPEQPAPADADAYGRLAAFAGRLVE